MQILISIFLPLILASVVFYFLRKTFSIKELIEDDTNLDINDLKKKYSKKVSLIKVLFLITAGVIGVFFYFSFYEIAIFSKSLISKEGEVLIAMKAFWALPSMFLGLVFSNIVLDKPIRKYFGDNYKEVELLESLTQGYNVKKIEKPMMKIVSFVCAVSLSLGFNTYFVIGKEEIRYNSFFSFTETRYQYSDIERLIWFAKLKAPIGTIKNTPHLLIKFKDGVKINSHNSIISDINKSPMKYLEKLSQYSDIKVEEFNIKSDVENL